ncbi:hypothetical protein [Roseovarius indicus]|uniref:hypothetical protein n=1 Tax=Roseovarius indicus TaxID=540747 RepID=UPI0013747DD5|nr:hypothetical protein [Roseovarius indicus]
MTDYQLIKVFGLQRSGNHAVLNWLLSLDQENMLFFNNLKLDQDILEAPSPVSLPGGVRAFSRRIEGKPFFYPELVDQFRTDGGTLVCSYEQIDMGSFDENRLDKRVFDEFGPASSRKNVLIVRNPFNFLPSIYKLFLQHHKGDDRKAMASAKLRLQRWKHYARLAIEQQKSKCKRFQPVLFERWLEERSYRDEVAAYLGLTNHDRNLSFVSDAGGGSSFEGLSVDRTKIASRWANAEKKEEFQRLVMGNKQVIDLAASLFGRSSIPEDILTLIETKQ